ncbi:MAG TPA: small ribosomal subunit Rsm22 family protein, partial [Limnochordia bacterium]|nr:small ribosomal subunit Rsm22 family protein [Limnochordia bacterium]
MQLPPALQAALDEALEATAPGALAASAEALSRRYRSGSEGSGQSYLRTAIDAAAYAAYRLPATYAAAHAALAQIRARRPDWRPLSLLDAGSGPGTLLWAAADVWPSIERITAIERDAGMAAIGRRLAAASPDGALRSAHWMAADLAAGSSPIQTAAKR